MESEGKLTLRSPAKINLCLKVGSKRPDGYHDISSLFAPVGLYDEIFVEWPLKGNDKVSFEDEAGAPLSFHRDTVSKALSLSKDIWPNRPSLGVRVRKKVPLGSGLGGGSSNAGTILTFLKDLLGHSQPLDLKKVALTVGADVPFFVGKSAAWVRGIGEVLDPLSLESFSVVIAIPPFSVSTPNAFAWFDEETALTRPEENATTAKLRVLKPGARKLMLREILEVMENDLERPVERKHPEISDLKKALRQWGALGSLMSGSGSSVYGVFKTVPEANKARENLKVLFPTTAFFSCEALV